MVRFVALLTLAVSIASAIPVFAARGQDRDLFKQLAQAALVD